MAVADGTILRIVASLLFPDNALAQNIFYVVFTDSGASNAVEDVLSDLSDYIFAVYDEMATGIQAAINLTDIKVYEYDGVDEDWDELGVEFPGDDFTGAGDGMPNGVAYLCAAETTNPDVTARKYIGGGVESNSTDNDLTGPLITALTALVEEWIAPFTGAATGGLFGPGVWSPTKTNFFLFNGVGSVNVQVAYQRRRKPGVGA